MDSICELADLDLTLFPPIPFYTHFTSSFARHSLWPSDLNILPILGSSGHAAA